MNAKKDALPTSYGSDLIRVDSHEIQKEEYEEIPELSDEAILLGTLKLGERTIYAYSHELITLHLPSEVFERWVASGPGWQSRMTKLLSSI
nr:BrnA antitoxin family protein [uncultured Duganella sp.]